LGEREVKEQGKGNSGAYFRRDELPRKQGSVKKPTLGLGDKRNQPEKYALG